MNSFWIYLIFCVIVFCICYPAFKLWSWLSIDPRQAIPDERFRQNKAQDRILANGFVDNEER